jgi:hypothetical protein
MRSWFLVSDWRVGDRGDGRWCCGVEDPIGAGVDVGLVHLIVLAGARLVLVIKVAVAGLGCRLPHISKIIGCGQPCLKPDSVATLFAGARLKLAAVRNSQVVGV